MTRSSILLALGGACVSVATVAIATGPISAGVDRVWTTSMQGSVYAAVDARNLSELCIEVDGVVNWLPREALKDIRDPLIEDAALVDGMGFSEIDERIPDWGNWGRSLRLTTHVERNGGLDEGPEYFFVLHEKRVVYRVRLEWVPYEESKGTRVQAETWLPVAPVAGPASCKPR